MGDYGRDWANSDFGLAVRCGRESMPVKTAIVGPMGTADHAHDMVADPDAQEARLAVAKWLYWSRGLRLHTLDRNLFSEPAWDLLLDLYIREKGGSRSSVTSACIGSRAPHTTALRHISALCKSKWISRIPDDADKRRFWLTLTSMAMTKLDRHFDQLVATAGFVSVGMELLD